MVPLSPVIYQDDGRCQKQSLTTSNKISVKNQQGLEIQLFDLTELIWFRLLKQRNPLYLFIVSASGYLFTAECQEGVKGGLCNMLSVYWICSHACQIAEGNDIGQARSLLTPYTVLFGNQFVRSTWDAKASVLTPAKLSCHHLGHYGGHCSLKVSVLFYYLIVKIQLM